MCPPWLSENDLPPARRRCLGCDGIDDGKGEVPERGKVMGRVPCPGSIVVLAHAHVFLAMECVLHLPVITNDLSRSLGRHLPSRRVGYGIGQFVVGLTGAMVEASTLDAEYLPCVRELRKDGIGAIDGDCDEFARIFATVPVIVGGAVRLQVAARGACARGGVQKARLIAFEGQNVDPPFSAIFVAVSRLVWAASAEIVAPVISISSSKSRAAVISLLFSGTPR